MFLLHPCHMAENFKSMHCAYPLRALSSMEMAVTFAVDSFLQKNKTLVKDLFQLKLGHFLFFFNGSLNFNYRDKQMLI